MGVEVQTPKVSTKTTYAGHSIKGSILMRIVTKTTGALIVVNGGMECTSATKEKGMVTSRTVVIVKLKITR